MSEKIFNEYVTDLTESLNKLDFNVINEVIEIFSKKIKNGNYIFLIGNGGSSATPSHSAGDFSKELGAKCLCLTDNTPSVTAWSNDTSYSNIFKGQLATFLNENDLVVGYSGSGNSENVLLAMEFAQKNGATTIGVTGNYNGKGPGKISKFSDTLVFFETTSMERIEDLQLIFNHMIKESLKIKND